MDRMSETEEVQQHRERFSIKLFQDGSQLLFYSSRNEQSNVSVYSQTVGRMEINASLQR